MTNESGPPRPRFACPEAPVPLSVPARPAATEYNAYYQRYIGEVPEGKLPDFLTE